MKIGTVKKEKIDLRTLFNIFNEKLGNKLICNKLYIVSSLRYWVDESDGVSTGVRAAFVKGDKPYGIEKLLFNPDSSNEEMIEDLKDFMAEAMVLGDHWKEYEKYIKIL